MLLRAKDQSAVYAVCFDMEGWDRGVRREVVLRSVQATDKTEVSVLGQSGELTEYRPDLDAHTEWEQQEDGLHISAMNAQRVYCGIQWRNPLVLKITQAVPAFEPLLVQTEKQGLKTAPGRFQALLPRLHPTRPKGRPRLPDLNCPRVSPLDTDVHPVRSPRRNMPPLPLRPPLPVPSPPPSSSHLNPALARLPRSPTPHHPLPLPPPAPPPPRPPPRPPPPPTPQAKQHCPSLRCFATGPKEIFF